MSKFATYSVLLAILLFNSSSIQVSLAYPATAIEKTLPVLQSNEPLAAIQSPNNNAAGDNERAKLVANRSLSTGHTEPVNVALFSPDSQRVATASSDTLIRLWQINPGNGQMELSCALFNGPYPIGTLDWSPDGKWLASGDTEAGLKIWEAGCGGRPARKLNGIKGSVRTVAFSPDGKWLASGGADNQLRIWSMESLQLVYTYDNGTRGVNSLSWAANGNHLAFGASNGRVVLVNFEGNSGNGLKVSSVNQSDTGGHPLRAVQWSPDSRQLVAGSGKGELFIFDLNGDNLTQKAMLKLNDDNSGINGLAYSRDGKHFATADSNRQVKLWQVAGPYTYNPDQTLSGHNGYVESVAFSTDGQRLLSASDDHTARLWESNSGRLISALGSGLTYQTGVIWSADGRQLWSGSNIGEVHAWQAQNLDIVSTLANPVAGQPENTASVRNLAISADGHWLAVAGDSGQIQLWNRRQPANQPSQILQANPAGTNSLPVYALVFSPDSRQLFSGGEIGLLQKWTIGPNDQSWQLSARNEVGRAVRALALSPTGDRLFSGSDDGQIRQWETGQLKRQNQWSAHQGYIKALVFSARDGRLISGGGDGRVVVWDSRNGQWLNGVQLDSSLKGLAISPDGQAIAVATADASISVYSSADNRLYLTVQGQSLATLGLAFAPNSSGANSSLAAVTLDGAIQVWQLDLSPVGNGPVLKSANPLQPLNPASPFVQAAPVADHLTLNGQPVKLKGLNFYPRLAPWGAMWQHWDGAQVQRDLDNAAALGANSLRVLIPYSTFFGWTKLDGTPEPEMLGELEQLLSEADHRHMRVLLTLFDFYADFPLAGTFSEAANWRYVDGVVSRYRNDPRILGWDIHNEPDNYSMWQQGKTGQVLDWLERTAQRVRQNDPNHWVTVGFGNNADLRQTGPDGINSLAMQDVAAIHNYEPTTITAQASDVRAGGAIHLPVFLEEYGWPSGPLELTDRYSEQVQLQHFQDTQAAIKAANLDGGIAWLLADASFESILHLKPVAVQNFGLLRLDGSYKPAATIFKSFTGTAFAPVNLNQTDSPALTRREVDESLYGLYFPETNLVVPSPFKEYWNRHGGLDSFGYPVSQVLVERGYLVQYFERARFEYHPEVETAPDFVGLDREQQLNRVVMLGLLVNEKLDRQGRHFEKSQPLPNQTFYDLTGHNLGGRFAAYWQAQGGLSRFGYPVSEEFKEVSATDGKTYTVQYFERARFEYHPDFAGSRYEVELGQLGREALPPPGSR